MKKTLKPTAALRKHSRKPRGSQSGRIAAHERALVAFADLARRLRLRWYVFGAQAVNVHGFPRATADLDLTVDLGDGPTPSFLRALQAAGFTIQFNDPDFVAATRVLPVIHRASDIPIDLVMAGPGLEQLFLEDIHLETIGRRKIPFITAENLIVTKVLANRPKDLQDIRELLARRPALDHDQVERLLSQLETALGQSDLVPLYRELRSQVTARR